MQTGSQPDKIYELTGQFHILGYWNFKFGIREVDNRKTSRKSKSYKTITYSSEISVLIIDRSEAKKRFTVIA